MLTAILTTLPLILSGSMLAQEIWIIGPMLHINFGSEKEVRHLLLKLHTGTFTSFPTALILELSSIVNEEEHILKFRRVSVSQVYRWDR